MRHVQKTKRGVFVFDQGHTYFFDRSLLLPEHSTGTADAKSKDQSLRSPMPGKVFKVFVAVGDTVSQGQPLVVVEAMKMEHSILAPSNGVVMACSVQVGDQVELGQMLLQVG